MSPTLTDEVFHFVERRSTDNWCGDEGLGHGPGDCNLSHADTALLSDLGDSERSNRSSQ